MASLFGFYFDARVNVTGVRLPPAVSVPIIVSPLTLPSKVIGPAPVQVTTFAPVSGFPKSGVVALWVIAVAVLLLLFK